MRSACSLDHLPELDLAPPVRGPSSLAVPQGVDEDLERQEVLVAAGIVEERARKALGPVGQHLDQGARLQVRLGVAVEGGDKARAIQGRNTLGAVRQTFFVQRGGWDHHDEVLDNQAAMLPEVSAAIGAFHAAMTAMGLQNQVCLFTASDFGRTLTSNGRGSDHAWGGNVFIAGGAVAGKDMYGSYPTLALNSALDLNDGVLIPTTPTDLYFAELAQWFGVPSSELEIILPNLSNFYNTSSGVPPIGFMKP